MKNPLDGYWKNCGINKGDTLLIHSSMKRAYLEIARSGDKADSEIVIDSLLREVGAAGTLVFPTFNFDFPQSKFFSINSTPSQMGKITEDVRTSWPGYRTGHPIYPFFAIGKQASKFSDIDNFSGFGKNSPFAILREMDAKICIVDLQDQESMTFYHHVEEMMEVEYRFHKLFKGMYENSEGLEYEREYSIFVRNLELGVVTNVNRMGGLLWDEGFYRGNLPGIGCGMRTIRAEDLFNRTARVIREGKAKDFLFSIQKQESKRSRFQ